MKSRQLEEVARPLEIRIVREIPQQDHVVWMKTILTGCLGAAWDDDLLKAHEAVAALIISIVEHHVADGNLPGVAECHAEVNRKEAVLILTDRFGRGQTIRCRYKPRRNRINLVFS